jgi:hypothetical protein
VKKYISNGHKNVIYGHKIHQIAIGTQNGLKICIKTFFIQRSSKLTHRRDFLYAYIPTGKPDLHLKIPLNEGARKKHAQV